MTTVQTGAKSPEALPERFPPAPEGLKQEQEDEEEALCARYEAELAVREGAETPWGCDYADGPMSRGGVLW